MAEQEPVEWFFVNLFKPLFSHAEVLELAGDHLKHDTLQNWANRKYVRPKLVNGKRRYNALEVAQVVLAQPLVQQLEMEPSSAVLSLMSAVLIFNRKLKAKEVLLSQGKYQMFVYTRLSDEPTVFDVRKAAPEIFEKDEAFIVLPVGRLLDDLATRQRELVESRTAENPVSRRAAKG